jgi:cytidyltransferase-like protein
MNIGLVPMAAKPYHAGHHWLVEKAASENDHVILFVSVSDRKRKGEKPILGRDMVRVWQEELEPVMPSNVEIRYGGSPVQNVYKEIQEAGDIDSEDTYFVYSDATDTALNYPEKNRIRYMGPLYDVGQVRFPGEEDPAGFTRGEGSPDVSGTAMRQALQSCDIDAFRRGLPAGVDAENVYEILCGGVNEQYLRAWVRAIIAG